MPCIYMMVKYNTKYIHWVNKKDVNNLKVTS